MELTRTTFNFSKQKKTVFNRSTMNFEAEAFPRAGTFQLQIIGEKFVWRSYLDLNISTQSALVDDSSSKRPTNLTHYRLHKRRNEPRFLAAFFVSKFAFEAGTRRADWRDQAQSVA